MSFQLKKINNEVVKPIPLPSIDPKLVKGNKLFAEIYANVFIVAKKKSGKTCTVFKIIKECCNKDTKVVIFASTLNKDLSFKVIRKYLENKGILYEEFTEVSAYLPAILEEIENDVDDEDNSEDEKEEEYKPKVLSFNDKEIKLKVKKRKPKYMAPQYLFLFDDISSDLRDEHLSKLVKQNRHYKSKVIISSQYPLDLKPDARKMIDYWLLFKGQEESKLRTLYENADLSVSFEQFYEMYKDATKEKHHFFYIDTNFDTFRKDFNFEYTLPKTEE